MGQVVKTQTGEIRCVGLEISATHNVPHERNLDELEQFILAAGHDFQEPLRTIKALTQLLARHHQEPDASGIAFTHIEGGVDTRAGGQIATGATISKSDLQQD